MSSISSLKDYKKTRKKDFYKEITLASNKGLSLEGLLQVIIDNICIFEDFTLGHVFAVDKDPSELCSAGIWASDGSEGYKDLKHITDATKFSSISLKDKDEEFEDVSSKPLDINKNSNFPRAKYIRSEGIKSAFGYRIAVDEKIQLFIELFSKDFIELNDSLRQKMSAVNDILCNFIKQNLNLKRIKSSENRYKTLFENAQVGLYRTTPDGEIRMVNPRLLEMLGFSSLEELVSRNLEDEGFSETSPRSEFKEILTRDGEVKNFESIWEEKNGKEIYVRENARELRSENGELLYYDGTVEDITELKLAIEKVEDQAALLDIATDAIFVLDMQDKILYWNRSCEQLYGWGLDEAFGKESYDLIYNDENSAVFDLALKIVKDEGNWEGELNHFTKEGEKIIVQSRWTLVFNKAGNHKSIFVVNTDITEKKRLEAQFLRAQRMQSLGTLAGGIAHDLNNMLQPIIMSLGILKMSQKDEKALELIDIIEKSSMRSTNLVKQVLSFAKGMDGEYASIQIKYIVEEVEKIVKETFPKSIEFITYLPSGLWTVNGDNTQLNQVIMNLCVNARDAMPEGGKLEISAENMFVDDNFAQMNIDAKAGPYLALTVTDTGTGIPPKVLDRIFEPFFTTKGPDKGTGLGLSTVFGIAKGHGGFVNVYSEIDKGTKFSIFLPADETTESNKIEERKPVDLPTGNGELILVVDDEVPILETVELTLKAYGYNVITAENGAQAIAIYAQKNNNIDAVITDMMMPVMDGKATIKALKTLNPEVKIIAVSGLKNKTLDNETDVKSFLPKPYKTDILLETLNNILKM